MYKKDEGILSWKMILKKICKSLIPKYVYENCKMEKKWSFHLAPILFRKFCIVYILRVNQIKQ